MLRYSLLRLAIFLACCVVAWAVFVREWPLQLSDRMLYAILGAAIVSMFLSFFLLRRERDRFAAQIERRVGAHLAHQEADEAAEDTEVQSRR